MIRPDMHDDDHIAAGPGVRDDVQLRGMGEDRLGRETLPAVQKAGPAIGYDLCRL